jgi:uncharacterized protein
MSFANVLRRCFFVSALVLTLAGGMAMAQSEPSLSEVYAAAQAGRLDQAQTMIQQVLVSHPNSAKAYFVRAELYARQGDYGRAREALASAEKFSPGLHFAKPEAVSALRAQLSAPVSASAQPHAALSPAAPAAASGPAQSSWVLPVLLCGGVLVLGYFLFRRRAPQEIYPAAPVPPAGYPGSPLSGPQGFGQAAGGMYPSQAEPGLGSRIMGGVATGLAVGAGVVAAEAIGKSLMGGSGHATAVPDAARDVQPFDANPAMGGTDFGIQDNSSWDDAGGGLSGGSDWDN